MFAAPSPSAAFRLRHQPGVSAEIWVAPSREAEFLVRKLPWLVSPADGRGSLISRFLRMVIVAPFSQLTFVSFELQAFLFGVFHRTFIARAGHFLGMFAAVTAGLAWLAIVGLQWPAAALLLFWYAAVARAARLPGWWLVMVPIVVGLTFFGQAWATHLAHAAATGAGASWAAPWKWFFGSALAVMMSHTPDSHMPPRVVAGSRWLRLPEILFGPAEQRYPFARVVLNALRLGMYVIWGTLDEAWAAPRLLPYNVLMLMFRCGYAKERAAALREYVDRAVAAGNPALDYVGTGGDTFLSYAEPTSCDDR